MFEYKAKLVRVIDGDTVDLLVDLGFNTFLQDRFRLSGIDAFETRGEEREKGLKAKDYLITVLSNSDTTQSADDITVVTAKNKKGKYGRWLATIYVGGVNVNRLLVETGHAVFYDY